VSDYPQQATARKPRGIDNPFTYSSSVLAGLDDARTLQSAKHEMQQWLHEIETLAAKKDEVLLKSLERIKELEAMFNAAPAEDHIAA
jgi:aconitase B